MTRYNIRGFITDLNSSRHLIRSEISWVFIGGFGLNDKSHSVIFAYKRSFVGFSVAVC